jgi:hypothetical protein
MKKKKKNVVRLQLKLEKLGVVACTSHPSYVCVCQGVVVYYRRIMVHIGHSKRVGGVAQVEEYLSSNHKALNLNPSTAKKKIKENVIFKILTLLLKLFQI